MPMTLVGRHRFGSISTAAPPGPAWVRLVHAIGQSSDQTTATTPARDTTSADLIVLCVTAGNAATVSDSEDNEWTPIPQVSCTPSLQFYWCKDPITSATHTFEITGPSTLPAIWMGAYTGSADGDPSDDDTGNCSASSATLQPGTATPTQTYDLVITACAIDGNGRSPFGVDGDFVILDSVNFLNGPPYAYGLAVSDLQETTIVAQDPTWTVGGAGPICAAIATFKSVAGSPPPGDHYAVAVDNDTPIAGSVVTITAQLKRPDNSNSPTPGVTVNWSKTGDGTLSDPSTVTDENGLATVTMSTSTSADDVETVTALDSSSRTGTSPDITTQAVPTGGPNEPVGNVMLSYFDPSDVRGFDQPGWGKSQPEASIVDAVWSPVGKAVDLLLPGTFRSTITDIQPATGADTGKTIITATGVGTGYNASYYKYGDVYPGILTVLGVTGPTTMNLAALVTSVIDSGTAQSATSTTLVLRSAAAFVDSQLVGATVLITAATTGAGQSRTITANVGSTDTVTVAAWDTTPTGTITYLIVPPPAMYTQVIDADHVMVWFDSSGLPAYTGGGVVGIYAGIGAAAFAPLGGLFSTMYNSNLYHTFLLCLSDDYYANEGSGGNKLFFGYCQTSQNRSVYGASWPGPDSNPAGGDPATRTIIAASILASNRAEGVDVPGNRIYVAPGASNAHPFPDYSIPGASELVRGTPKLIENLIVGDAPGNEPQNGSASLWFDADTTRAADFARTGLRITDDVNYGFGPRGFRMLSIDNTYGGGGMIPATDNHMYLGPVYMSGGYRTGERPDHWDVSVDNETPSVDDVVQVTFTLKDENGDTVNTCVNSAPFAIPGPFGHATTDLQVDVDNGNTWVIRTGSYEDFAHIGQFGINVTCVNVGTMTIRTRDIARALNYQRYGAWRTGSIEIEVSP